MRLVYAPAASRAFAEAPPQIQKTFLKQVALLRQNLGHPSLRAKKYDEARNIWQARVSRAWRFYFIIEGDAYVILDIVPHPK